MGRPKAKRSPFLRKLEIYGLQKLGTADPKKALVMLRLVRKMTTGQIAGLLGFTDEAVRYWLEEFGLARAQVTFPEKVMKMPNPKTGGSYRSLKEFFIVNVDRTFGEIGEMTGFSSPTVSKYYGRFVDGYKAEKGVV